MTIKELIELLVQYPQEARVVVAGYEGGYNDIANINPIPLQLNVHKEWYYGQHERAGENVGEQAVLLEGMNKMAIN